MIDSSFFRKKLPACSLCFLLGWSSLSVLAHADSSAREESMRRYMARQWGPGDGINGNRINAVAQTPDGYLWIGTDTDLLRFDGFQFQSIQPDAKISTSIRHVLSLTVDREGALWVRTANSRLLRYADGHFTLFFAPPHGDTNPLYAESAVISVAPAQNGGLIVQGLAKGLLHLTEDKLEPIPLKTSSLMISLAQASDGRIWVGTRETGLFSIKDNVVTAITQGIPDLKINCLLPVEDNKVWIGTDNGLALWNGHEAVPQKLNGDMEHLQILAMVQDRERNLWIGTSRGLIRYNQAGAQWLPGTTHDTAITALFEDRQGDLWFGDGNVLERIRDTPLITYGAGDQFPSGHYGPVFADTHGRTWFAPVSGGLYWMRDGVSHSVTQGGLGGDIVYSIDGTAEDIWVGRQKGGLTQLHLSGDSFTAKTWTTRDGLAENSVFAVRVAHDGSVWAGTLTAGASHLMNGRFSNFNSSNGLSSNAVNAIEESSDQTVWFATPEGLSTLHGTQWKRFTLQDGLPSEDITSLLSTSDAGMWIGTSYGMLAAHDGKLHKIEIPSLSGDIRGMALDQQGLLWVATKNQVVSIPSQNLLANPAKTDGVRTYGRQDGLRSADGERRSRSVVTDSDGRVWIATADGLAVSSLLPAQKVLPTLPHLEGIVSDDVSLPLTKEVQIPAGSHRITFHYAGIYLLDPERVRFRYQLENFDKNWSSPTSERAAVYTNLPPGQYRFRVMTSNGDGSWNFVDDSQVLTVHPLLWQSWEFKFLCAAAFLLIGIWIYRIRVQLLISQANMRSEERLIERTAIARELHDTLLQSFQALILFFQMGVDQLPPDAAARRPLEDALLHSDQVMREGRERLVSLRASMAAPELNKIFSVTCEELNRIYPTDFSVSVTGEPRSLQTIAQEELSYLGKEAINNAFRHADATHISVRLAFEAESLTMIIQDNGSGIPHDILRYGAREGHWGLAGMRERARKIGAHLDLRSRPAHGTEIEVRLDAPLIYESQAGQVSQPWLWPLLSSWRRMKRHFARE